MAGKSGAQSCGTIANCTAIDTFTQPGLYPSSFCLNPVVIGTNDTTTLQFKIFDSIVFSVYMLQFSTLKIDSIGNLPPGLCWSCNSPNQTYNAGETGCINITGTPTDSANAGQYQLTIFVDVNTELLGLLRLNGNDLGLYYYVRAINKGDPCLRYVDTTGQTQGTLLPFIQYVTGQCPNTGTYCRSSTPLIPQGSLTAQGPSCGGGTGQLTFTATAGNWPFTVVYTDGTTQDTATGVFGGTAFNVANEPVSATTTYTLVSVTGADGGERSDGFTSGAATITISPILTDSVFITASQTFICPNAVVTFTAATFNPGDTPVYHWKKNGLAVGGDSATYTSNNLLNGDSVWCVLTSNKPCVELPTVSSNKVFMQVGLIPYVTISGNPTVCVGNTDTFKVSYSVPGTNPVFTWKKNGAVVGNDSVLSISALATNDSIECFMNVTAACPPSDTFSNTIIMTEYSGASGQAITITGNQCQLYDTLKLSGGLNDMKIVWQDNGKTEATIGPIITTVAGDNGNGDALNQFTLARSTAVDAAGYLYVSDLENDRILKFPPNSTPATFGTAIATGTYPGGLCFDTAGNLYVADFYSNNIIKILPGHTSGTVVVSNLYYPSTVYVDDSGYIFVTDGNEILKFPATGNSAATIAARQQLNGPGDVLGDDDGNIYVANRDVVYRFPPNSDSTTVPTVVASLQTAWGTMVPNGVMINSISIDRYKNIYVSSEDAILKYPAGGNERSQPIVVAGGNGQNSGSDQLNLILYGWGIDRFAVDSSENIYVPDIGNGRIQKYSTGTDTAFIPPQPGNYTALAYSLAGECIDTVLPSVIVVPSFPEVNITPSSNPVCPGPLLVTGTAVGPGNTPVYQWFKNGLAVGSNSLLYTDSIPKQNDTIQLTMHSTDVCALQPDTISNIILVNLAHDSVTLKVTGASCMTGDTIVVSGAQNGYQVIWSLNGNVLDSVLAMPPVISTVAGGSLGNADNQLYGPIDVWVDSSGYLFVVDEYNSRVLKFPPGSDSSTLGTCIGGNGLDLPTGIFVTSGDDVYVADAFNSRVQEFSSDNSCSPGLTAISLGSGFSNPVTDVCLDPQSNMYVVDEFGNRILKYSPLGINPTVIGGGNGQGSGANQLHYPSAIALDKSENVYVADWLNNRIQYFPKGSNSQTTAFTIGGNGNSSGTQLSAPAGVFVDSKGFIYVADYGNNRVQRFPPYNNVQSAGVTVAGLQFLGDTDVLKNPGGVYVDAQGNLYIPDGGNSRVRKYSARKLDSLFIATSPGTYTAAVTTSEGCLVQSNAVVLAHGAVSVSITVSGDSSCQGSPVTFNALPVNGGLSPAYTWFVNGSAAGGNSSSFVSDSLHNGDLVSTQLISDAACITDSFAISNVVTVVVYPRPAKPLITLTGNDTLTCSENADSYVWFFNGAVANFNTQTIVATQSGMYQVIDVINGCISDTSAAVVFTSTNCTTIFADTGYTICSGDTFYLAGKYYIIAGTYADTLTNTAGCDSIVIFHLSVNNLSYTTINDTVCGSAVFSGKTITQSGIYYDTLQTINGCDSFITLHLTVNQPAYDTIAKSICEGDTLYIGNTAYTNSGNYFDTLINNSGCDSIVSLIVTVNPLPSVTIAPPCGQTGTGPYFCEVYAELSAAETYSDSVTWTLNEGLIDTINSGTLTLYYGNQDSLPGTTVAVPANQPQVVCITAYNACGTITTCDTLTILVGGIEQITDNNAISIYPNPTSDQLFIKIQGIRPLTTAIYDAEGCMICTLPFKPALDVSKLSSGIYLLEVQSANAVGRQRFVVLR